MFANYESTDLQGIFISFKSSLIVDEPSLVLLDPSMKDFIVDHMQFARCIVQWPVSGGESMGNVYWCHLNNNGVYSRVSCC